MRRNSSPPSDDARSPRAPAERVYDAFAIAAPGIAGLLASELRALDIAIGDVSAAGVAFKATTDTLLTVNLWSRLATRVLVRLAEFTARDFATLEKQAARVSWADVVAPGSAVRFRVTCRKSRLYHSDAVAERVARGVLGAVKSATLLQHAKGAEGADDHTDDDTGDEAAEPVPEQLIIVRFEHDVCTISADASGALLHRRGWRQAVAKAPLRETLAAAMLAQCDWHGERALVDPFCGSGTIGIEAALRARNIAPGLARSFAMERWPSVRVVQVEAVRGAARAQARPQVGAPIVLSDRDAGACEAARANAERAGVSDSVEIRQCALSDVSLAAIASSGLLLSNPPYGQRVSQGADLRGLYARFGDVVKAGGRGWQVGLLIPDRRLVSSAKLGFTSAFRTSNGGIPVSLEMTATP